MIISSVKTIFQSSKPAGIGKPDQLFRYRGKQLAACKLDRLRCFVKKGIDNIAASLAQSVTQHPIEGLHRSPTNSVWSRTQNMIYNCVTNWQGTTQSTHSTTVNSNLNKANQVCFDNPYLNPYGDATISKSAHLPDVPGGQSSDNGHKNNSDGKYDLANVALCSAAVVSSCTHRDEDNDTNDLEVTSEEVKSAVEDLNHVLQLHSAGTEANPKNANEADHYLDDWVMEWEGPAVTIWSRPLENKEFRQYKVHGRYTDIPAVAFFYIQLTETKRNVWDSSTDEIIQFSKTVVGLAEETGLIYWRVNFPRPLSKRDYVFARRHLIDLDRNVLVLINRTVSHPGYPVDPKFVRVTDYHSKMVVQPHTSFTENGFDYVMTYIDDTKTKMPGYAMKRLVRNGLPRFLVTVCKESETVMNKYKDLKASGADMTNCSDIRVKELHELIEQAKLRQQLALQERVEKEAKDAAKDDTKKDICSSTRKAPSFVPSLLVEKEEECNSVKPVLIHKIRPPCYLPDLSKYFHTVMYQRKFFPIPLRKVHQDSDCPQD